VPPVLATTSRLVCAQPEALEHGTLLLERVVIALAAAEAVPEVLVVLVVGVRLLRMDASLSVGLRVDAQVAGARLGESRGAAVACKVPLSEDLDEGVLAVALDRAGVADTGGIVGIRGVGGRRIASQACEDALSERAKGVRAVLNTLAAR
jgi:hypothetical protein